ncbi:MAG: IPTL-CTERM sorting domain-containing protein, partial [Deltaproteobacteria bacterium]|nr:IPTL-CTERM sorting domain-containing protein [Deltaproteobacteria bacterium]
ARRPLSHETLMTDLLPDVPPEKAVNRLYQAVRSLRSWLEPGLEAGAASLHTQSGGAYATLAVPSGQALAQVRAVGNPSPGDAPSDAVFPYGFFQFTVQNVGPGGCTTVTLYLPRNTALVTYYKYGPTPDDGPDDATDHWYAFMYDGQTGAQIFQEAQQTRVVLHLCDGQRGDDDLSANGTIVDQGGPAQIQAPPEPIPTLSEWGLILMGLFLALAALLARRRFSRA